jgi:diguanylate cyclase (GGDEF)-like protein
LGLRSNRDYPAHLSPQVAEVYDQYETDAKAEHLKLILNQSTFVLFGNYAAGLTVLIGSWHAVDKGILIAWFFFVVGFNTLRTLAGRRFVPDQIERPEIDRWERRLLGSTLLSGVLWGSAGYLLYLPGELDHNFFLAVPIIAMSAAAVTSYSYHQIAYPLFFVPAVTPLILSLIQEPSASAKAIGLVTPLYFLMMYLLSRRIYRAAHAAVLSGFANQHFANHDYLTGIANRRAFQEALEREWARALRTGKPISLVIADIDDFKQCNDTYGHSIGDKVLKAIAMMILHRARKGIDMPARIGGEEFAVILPETNLADACRIAEDIRTRAHAIQSDDRTEMPGATLSLGVASLVPDAEGSASILFNRSDQALYRAKLEGKDRFVADRAGETPD